jgi:hypothetical protein
MKYLIGAAALAMSTAALAQTTTTTATPAAPATAPAQTTTETTKTTTSAPADMAAPAAAPATTQTTESTTTTTAQAAPAPTPAADPKAVLAQQFPTYDKDGNGTLSQTEFAAWLVEMKTAQNSEKLTPEQISKWANDSFAKADKDKSKSVTVAELQGFLVPNA